MHTRARAHTHTHQIVTERSGCIVFNEVCHFVVTQIEVVRKNTAATPSSVTGVCKYREN